MTNITRPCIVLFTFLTIIAGSCKKETAKDVPAEDSKPIVTTPPDEDADTGKIYLPVQIAGGSSKITFGYNHQSLSKIEYLTENRSVVLSFDAKNNPLQLEKFSGETLTYLAEYTLDEHDRVVRSDQYTVAKNQYKLTGYYTLEYETRHQPERITYFNIQRLKINEKLRSYDLAGNLLRETRSSPEQILNYTYDVKNAVFKNAGYVWLFALETEDDLLLSQLNNIVLASADSSKPENLKVSYVYNKQDYPEAITMATEGDVLTYKVIYQ